MKKRERKPETELIGSVQNGVLRFNEVPKWRVPHTFHSSKTFMDYLHGDVKEEEAWSAFGFEFARESRSVWEGSERRDEWMRKGSSAEDAAFRALQEIEFQNNTSCPSQFADFLACVSFPKKDWNELSEEERKQIMRFDPPRGTRPLRMPDMWTLNSMRVLDKFKAMGVAAEPEIEELLPGQSGKPIELVPALLQQYEALFHAIFTLDYSKSETQLLNEFHEWLRLEENQRRLESYKRPKIGTTGAPLDRLKDLAGWRLYRELNNDLDAANKFANEHRKGFTRAEIQKKYPTKDQRKRFKSGSPRPFRDAKKQAGQPPNEADLFSEDADARKAKASAYKHLTEIMPREFRPPPGPAMLAVWGKLDKLAAKK